MERAEAVGSDLSAFLVGAGSGSKNSLHDSVRGQHNSMRWVFTMHNEAAIWYKGANAWRQMHGNAVEG